MQPRAPRFRVGGLNFVYDTGEGFWAGSVYDLSESGVFIETSHQLPVGTRVTLVPDVPDNERLPFEIRAEVVRSNEDDIEKNFMRPPGIAFRLVDLRQDHFDLLKQFLQLRGIPVRQGARV